MLDTFACLSNPNHHFEMESSLILSATEDPSEFSGGKARFFLKAELIFISCERRVVNRVANATENIAQAAKN